MRTFPVNENSFFSKVRQYLVEYGKSSNIHGLHYLVEKRSKTEKFFWILILLLSLSGCSVMIYKLWKRYMENPIVISFAPRTVPIYEISFPAVTICPETKCDRSKFNYSSTLYKIVNNETVTAEERQKFYYVDLLCENDEENSILPIIAQTGSRFIGDDFFDVINEVKPNFDVKCTFLGTNCRCEQYFTPIITDQGICYSFNILDKEQIFRENVVFSKKFYKVTYKPKSTNKECRFVEDAGIDIYPLRAFLSGVDNALELYFRYNSLDTDYECNLFLQGYRIAIHDPVDIPRLSKYYFRVPLDKAVMVAVEPDLVRTSHEVKNYKANKRRCFLSDERPLKFFKTYSQPNCIFECWANYTLESCGCVLYYMPRENNTPICGQRSEDCLIAADDQLKIDKLKVKKSGIISPLCDCIPSCTELKYNVETSQSEFYWKEYSASRKIKNNKTTRPEERYSYMNVYFKNEQFTAIERKELHGISDLISNFGGLLGLFTGFSLISLFEIIYFLTLRLFCNNQIHNNWDVSDCSKCYQLSSHFFDSCRQQMKNTSRLWKGKFDKMDIEPGIHFYSNTQRSMDP